MTVTSNITNAQLAAQIQALIALWNTRETQMVSWISGAAGGGDQSNGTYPLSDYLGDVTYVKSPAQLQADADGTVNSAATQATAAAGSATSASAAQAAAITARTLASTYATNAAASAALALISQNAAASSAASALASKNAAAASASAAASSASGMTTSVTDAASSAAAAASSTTAAAASAGAASTDAGNAAASAAAAAASAASLNPALFARLAGASFTGAVDINNGDATALIITTPNATPWAFSIARTDDGSSARMFNSGGGTLELSGSLVTSGTISAAAFTTAGTISFSSQAKAIVGPNSSGIYLNNDSDGVMYLDSQSGYSFRANGGNTTLARLDAASNLSVGGGVIAGPGFYTNNGAQREAIGDFNDGWLRLNNDNAFTNGIYTPGIMRIDGLLYSGVGGGTSAYFHHSGNHGGGSVTISSSAPSGGADGDLWIQV